MTLLYYSYVASITRLPEVPHNITILKINNPTIDSSNYQAMTEIEDIDNSYWPRPSDQDVIWLALLICLALTVWYLCLEPWVCDGTDAWSSDNAIDHIEPYINSHDDGSDSDPGPPGWPPLEAESRDQRVLYGPAVSEEDGSSSASYESQPTPPPESVPGSTALRL